MYAANLAALLCFTFAFASLPKVKDQSEYTFRAFPMVMMPGSDVTLTAENSGPLTEANYCLGIEIVWPNGTKSSHIPDCPSWDDYQAQLAHAEMCAEEVVVCPPGYDCFYPSCKVPPYDLQRRWTIHTRQLRLYFGPGDWDLTVNFLLPNKKKVVRSVTIHVGGQE